MRLIPPFLSRLFRRAAVIRPDGISEELWSPDRLVPGEGRFASEAGRDWEAVYRDGRLEIELRREGIFAWSTASLHSYDDFFVEGQISFPTDLSYGAAGFLFRYVDEHNFYFILLSNRGHFRLDTVFNGSPRALIAWTEVPGRLLDPTAPARLRLIARGPDLTVMVDGDWVGEVSDDSSRAGDLAFAAQLYSLDPGSAGPGREGVGPPRFGLASILVESRPLEVEALFQRFVLIDEPESRSRRILAETFAAMGQHLSAAVQVRKIEKRRSLDADELLLKAETNLRLELLGEASEALDAALLLDPTREEALLEKANLLHRRGLYLELRDFALALPGPLRNNPRVAVLLGHARFNLGDYRGAALSYAAAADAEPEQPLLRMNEARAWEQAGERREAVKAYLVAARGFFTAEARDELSLAEKRLVALAKGSPELREIRARALFLSGDYARAAKLIDAELAGGSSDSSLGYLGGLIRLRWGDPAAALPFFERAFALEPSAAIFAWRRAETLFLLGRPEAKAAIEEALAFHPEDGWTLNLAGQLVLDSLRNELEMTESPTPRSGSTDPAIAGSLEARLDLARRRLEMAARKLPGRPEPSMNFAELLSLEGRTEEALELLRRIEDSAEALNQAGNILVRAGKAKAPEADEDERDGLYARAESSYKKAIALEPRRADFHENLAALFIESGRWSDAEGEIRRSLELGTHPRAYLLAGNLAEVYGDFARAEASFTVGLETAPEHTALLMALGRLRITLRRWDRARESAGKLAAISPELSSRLE
ncbi:MAG: tetratricopeptide repeat protein, partial [Spirochaetota bacterium]